MKLLIASRNPHKIEEIKAIFSDPALELLSADDIPGLPEVEEDSPTFHGNAVKKALTLALFARMWALADDSGLEVDALDGAPGVYSARYAGEPADYNANNQKLLMEMQDKPCRTAGFRCVIALCSPQGTAQTVEGVCKGKIGYEPRGTHGFGYDPLFIPEGFDQTFAELDAGVKNKISHRAIALANAREKWSNVFKNQLSTWPGRL